MKHWKTNLGGAVSITGTALLGIGLLPGATGLPPEWVKYFIAAGLLFSAAGKGITALFAADATAVKQVAANVQTVAKAVDEINKSGTDFMAKPLVAELAKPKEP